MSHASMSRRDHRPWPMPSTRWTWSQAWMDALFAHWPVPVEKLRRFIPDSLEIEQFEGSAWIGIVPFRMEGVRPRFCPSVPGVSSFSELNVRTYVSYAAKPGVWFFSLDASSSFAVWAARRFFHLEYFRARMDFERHGEEITYSSTRLWDGPETKLVVRYRPVTPPVEAQVGSLEHWLIERYCLYTVAPDGTLLRGDVHYPPWPLQRAEASIEVNSMLAPLDLVVSSQAPLLHFARRVNVALWDFVAAAGA